MQFQIHDPRKQVRVGSTILTEGREAIVESLEPADARGVALESFPVYGSLFTR